MKSRPPPASHGVEEQNYLQLMRSVILQRNGLIVLIMAVLGISLTVLFRLYHISTHKMLSPFVIEVEERTGLTKVVTPAPPERYMNDDVVRNVYIQRYVIARESYSPSTYDYNYYTVIPALSTDFVASNFNRFIYSTNSKIKNPSPEAQRSLIRLFSNQDVMVKIKTIKSLEEGAHNIPGKAVQVYFTQYAVNNDYELPRERIATIGYDFNQENLPSDIADVNPLRFRVLYYNLTDVTTEKM